MRRFIGVLLLLLTGCAGPANFPAQPMHAWGFYQQGVVATSVSGYTWLQSREGCDAARANEIASSKKNEREGKLTFTVEECKQLSIVAGGSWWGYTLAIPGVGQATNSKEICEIVRRSISYASQCTPVTVQQR